MNGYAQIKTMTILKKLFYSYRIDCFFSPNIFRTTLSLINVPFVSIKTIHTTTNKSSLNELIINDIVFNSNGILIISWEYMLSRLPKYYHIQIYDKNHHHLIFQRLINGQERSTKIDISHYIQKFPSILIVCINIQYRKYCRNIYLQSNTNSIKTASLILSSNKYKNERLIYLLGGILLGTILVCSMFFIMCYYRFYYYYSKETRTSMNSNEKSLQTFYYHPLNIISYPQQPSSNTSECSLHSSIDANHLTNDPYHIYQQIPSIKACHRHSNGTHILV